MRRGLYYCLVNPQTTDPNISPPQREENNLSLKFSEIITRFVINIYDIRRYYLVNGWNTAQDDIDYFITHQRLILRSAEIDLKLGRDGAQEEIDLATDALNRLVKARAETEDEILDTLSQGVIIEMDEKSYVCDPRIFPSYGSAFSRGLAVRGIELLGRSTIIQAVSAFEMLIADLLHLYYRNYPGSLNSKEVTLTLEDIKEFGNIDDYLSHVIDEEVDSFMMQSMTKWVAFFERLKVDFKDCAIDWKRFQEYWYRRNIIVHNNAVVNKRYLNGLKELGQDTNLQEGDKLYLPLDYIKLMTEDILAFGESLTFKLWHKFSRTDENKVSTIHDLIYDSMMRDLWNVSLKLCEELDSLSNDPADRLVSQVNRWLSLKRQGRFDTIKSDLDKFSHHTHHPRFSAAVYALSENKDEFFKILPKADLTFGELVDWPILSEIRSDDRFREAVLNSINDEVREYIVERENNNTRKSPSSKEKLETLTVKELKRLAEEIGVDVTSSMRKSDIIELLIKEAQADRVSA